MKQCVHCCCFGRDQVFKDEGKDVVPGVWEVLDKIKVFSEKVSSGRIAHKACCRFTSAAERSVVLVLQKKGIF